MRYVTRALCIFPIFVLASFYATWVAGRLALGYWPRSSLDDPKNIEGGLMWTYDVTAISVLYGVPLFGLSLLVFVLICFVKRPDGWKTRLLELAGALVLFVGLAFFSHWDPQSVIEWFFD
jgi:hypothetical protein